MKNEKNINSPDVEKMQKVVIDENTTIYISMDASAEEARNRYSEYLKSKKKF